jgi:hypothetical protein
LPLCRSQPVLTQDQVLTWPGPFRIPKKELREF